MKKLLVLVLLSQLLGSDSLLSVRKFVLPPGGKNVSKACRRPFNNDNRSIQRLANQISNMQICATDNAQEDESLQGILYNSPQQPYLSNPELKAALHDIIKALARPTSFCPHINIECPQELLQRLNSTDPEAKKELLKFIEEEYWNFLDCFMQKHRA